LDSKKILKKAKKDKVQLIKMQFSDIHGSLKSATIPVEKLESAVKRGLWFDGSSIEGFTRIAESDMYLKPDISTYALVPWEKESITARFICDVYSPDGKPFEGDPRFILKKQLEKARKAGFEYFVGPELEFFLFENNGNKLKPALHDNAGYFDLAPQDKAANVRKQIMFALKNFGIEAEMAHHEVAAGQHEIDFKYDNALKTADNAMTFKYVVKSIAHLHDLHASFMPKPVFGINGSGMHVHQSLFDLKKKKNLFYDAKAPYFLSKTALHFIGGQLKHAKAFSAVICPTVNSYKRLTPGYEAPVYICWAQRNRSALIRIPRIFKNESKAARAELRCPDPSSNPYLAFTVMLAAAMDGIKNKLMPPKPIEENVYALNEEQKALKGINELPYSLFEALQELKKDSIIMESLGPHLKNIYIKAKEKEFNEYRIQVTEWELKKYFEII